MSREIEDDEIGILEIVKLIWSRRKVLLLWGGVAAILGVVVAFSIPKLYRSSTSMVAEVSDNSQTSGSLGQLASLAGVNMGESVDGITEKLYPEIVGSKDFILQFATMKVPFQDDSISLIRYFVKEYETPWWNSVFSAPKKLLGLGMSIFKEKKEKRELEDIDFKMLSEDQYIFLKRFRESVSLVIDSKSGIIVINGMTQSPEISYILVESVLERLKSYIYLYKTSKVRSELESNSLMLEEARKNYYLADSLFANASDRSKNISSQSALLKIDRLENEKNLTFQLYTQLASQVELNRAKLNESKPILTTLDYAVYPIKAASPNKIIVLITFIFLGMVAAAAKIVLSDFFN